VRLIVIATVFVGIISLAGDLILRLFGWGARSTSGGWVGGWGGGRRRSSNSSSSSSSSSGKGGGGAVIVLILVAIVIFLIARLLAVVLRLALSRQREYMADAGAVELTKNPDAMIAALRAIQGHTEIAGVPADVREMFLDNPAKGAFESLFASHPSIENRVAALVRYAGGRDPGPPTPALPPAEAEALPDAAPAPDAAIQHGPWG
jgi:heat shock protein HtpX